MRKLTILFFLAIFLFVAPKNSYALAEKFSINTLIQYQLFKDNPTKITHRTTITNLESDFAPEKIYLNVGLVDLTKISATDRFGSISTTFTSATNSSTIVISPHQPGAGVGKSTSYVLNFQSNSIMQKLGNVIVVTTPINTDLNGFSNFDVSINYDNLLTKPFFQSPENQSTLWKLLKNENNSVQLFFWADKPNMQQYLANIKYTLSNKKLYSTSQEIIIPSDDQHQKVAIDSINPAPSSMRRDSSGNWIASYVVGSNKTIDIDLQQRVDLSNENNATPSTSLKAQLPKFWEQLKSRNPDLYSCQKTNEVLARILKENNIESRQISGSQFPSRNTLHCWLELKDPENGFWLMSDPLLALKTKRIEYLAFWDPFHIAIYKNSQDKFEAVSNISSITLKPNSDYSPIPTTGKIDFHADVSRETISGFDYKAKINIKNVGEIGLSNLKIFVSTKHIPAKNPIIELGNMPPLSETQTTIQLDKIPWNYTGDDIITLELDGKFYSYPVKFIPLYQSIPFLSVGGLFVIAFIFITTQITRGVFFQRRKR